MSIVKNDFYVDDLLTGADNVDEAKFIYTKMNELLKKGGFELQKWSSNRNDLFDDLYSANSSSDARGEAVYEIGPEKDKTGELRPTKSTCKEPGDNDVPETENNNKLHLKLDKIMKILGLTWNRSDDTFRYTVNTAILEDPVTKRKIISDISRFYDPLGWVGPCIIVTKMIIQKLWLAGIGWDEPVPDKILNEWLTYREEFTRLAEVSIPRWMGNTKNAKSIELHGFCDASKFAYAAVVYIRTLDTTGEVQVALVTAKTKVAPIKQVSIPRLELCGAVLVTRLLKEVAKILNIPLKDLRAWTDSTIVLAWLNDHPKRWKDFVANRVSEIMDTLNPKQWSHVSSKKNPADCASRGLSPSELVSHELWFNGPQFLKNGLIDHHKPGDLNTELEALHCTEVELTLRDRYSSLTKLLRVAAYCRRFINNTKNGTQKRTERYLVPQELKEVLNIFIKQDQAENFEEEIKSVIGNTNLHKRSLLKSLNPFMDDSGLLRVGGRLENADVEFGKKHPIILPKDTSLSKLIVRDAHYQTLHGGPQLMLSYLSTKYYIIGGKRAVKACFRKCVTCLKNSAVTKSPMMGQLPTARITPMRAFKNCGLDYAGPIQIRTTKGRGHKSYKGYICLFICMSTRAVHLEAVTELTSEAFLQAFRRFVARRGYCSDLFSDNGTNFIGAAKELRKLTIIENDSLVPEIKDSLATHGCNWHFIPPHSPNFGGLWEAGIKSIKYHLKRVIGEATLTYEEISTVLAQIEACLNSRPMSVLTDEKLETFVLTPGHFLIGEPLLTAPDYDYESRNVSSLRRWQHTRKLLQDFWKQWSQEYISRFLHRYKWSDHTNQPKLGDIVLVKENNLPPSKWLFGRIVTLHPGADQICRVVSIQTKDSNIKRPTNKLCILPVSE